MKPSNEPARILVATAIILFVQIALSQQVAAQGFDEQFNAPILDPAWQVVPYTGPRLYGFPPPANDYSLSMNPGYLRYIVTPMTHPDGFLNNYQDSYHSCCLHNPGLELHRTFSGDQWLFEAKGDYFLTVSNGRWLELRLYFGDGGPGTFCVKFMRGEDFNAFTSLLLFREDGPSLFDRTYFEQFSLSDFVVLKSIYWRLQRAGGVLTASLSEDGVNWTTVWSHDLGTQLDGLQQRVVIAGLSWFNPAGAYADYDYIKVTPSNQPPVAKSKNVIVSAGSNCTADASIDDGSFDPDVGDTITLSQSPSGPYQLGTTSVTLTATDSHGASSQSTATITVVDNTPPTTSAASVDKPVLWPPDHKLVDVAVNYTATDNCGPLTCALTVTSNEQVNGTGDGDSAPDWEVLDAHHLRLRAERAGSGNGRTYTITITCADSAGNSSSRTATVTVPRDRR